MDNMMMIVHTCRIIITTCFIELSVRTVVSDQVLRAVMKVEVVDQGEVRI